MKNQSYFEELVDLPPTKNQLFRAWTQYALSLSRDDVLYMVRNGLTHQISGLRSMLREIIGGRKVPKSLLAKIEIIAVATKKHAARMR